MSFKKIGALWLKEGNSGKYMAGEIEIKGEKFPIMIFKNRFKDTDKKPDYTVQMTITENGAANNDEAANMAAHANGTGDF